MGQPAGHGEAALRGAVEEGGPSLLPQLLQLSWAPGSLRLCGAQWGPCPPPPRPLACGGAEALSRHLEMPGLGVGGIGPAPHYPQSPEGSLQGVAITVGREDTWPGTTFAPAQAGLRPPAQWPPAAPSHLNHSFPHPLNSWCFQGNYLMKQQCGDCGGGMGLSPSTRPTGHGGHLRGSGALCSLPLPPPPPTD